MRPASHKPGNWQGDRGAPALLRLLVVTSIAVCQKEDSGDDYQRKDDQHQPARVMSSVKSECQHCVHDAFFL
jgi:hypothetical protein